jgi:uncharacterized protein with FMN-binding domain
MKPLHLPRPLVLLLGTTALAFPAAAAASTKTTKFTGATMPAQQWGTVTVDVTAQKAGTPRFTDLGGGYTYHTSRSQFIMSQALPLLRQEFLVAQSARIHMVSGATYTSQAFITSLQSALLKAHA